MKLFAVPITLALIGGVFFGTGNTQEEKAPRTKSSGRDWTATEYSGSRTTKDLRSSVASKGFAWLSGSPVDNEKLSIGKNAQFFGFVALRYESGRAANRGALGRAFFSIVDSEQRKLLPAAVLAEATPLQEWWVAREKILRLFEDHLYTGEPIDEEMARSLGAEFSELNAKVAIHEARAYAALEDSLTDGQRAQLKSLREDPETAHELGGGNPVAAEGIGRDQLKQLEDLYAKAFSWITGTPADNEIIPLGQPAQFFGFVSIRHKSGHAASRGKIAKSFLAMLSPEQVAVISAAVETEESVVRRFLEKRHEFLGQLALLRTEQEVFDEDLAMELAAAMGIFEVEAGWIEAKAYRQIRESMTDEQTTRMMKLRGDYVLDESQVELLAPNERGAQLAILCAACHGKPGQHRAGMIGPTLDGIFDRPIASAEGFAYSEALQKLGGEARWTPEKMDQFLVGPKAYAPGTKMEFQGLLNAEDREGIINYLQQTR